MYRNIYYLGIPIYYEEYGYDYNFYKYTRCLSLGELKEALPAQYLNNELQIYPRKLKEKLKIFEITQNGEDEWTAEIIEEFIKEYCDEYNKKVRKDKVDRLKAGLKEAERALEEG